VRSGPSTTNVRSSDHSAGTDRTGNTGATDREDTGVSMAAEYGVRTDARMGGCLDPRPRAGRLPLE